MSLLSRGVSSLFRSRVYSHQRNYARIQNQPRIKQSYNNTVRRSFCSAQQTKTLNFNDTKAAFQAKSTPELLRAWFVFKLCGIPWIVKNSETLINTSKKVLGKTLTMWVIKKTFFAHFCAGENEKDIQPVMDKLRLAGIGGILDYAAENDVDEDEKRDREGVISARTFDYAGEAECDKNAEIFQKAIRAVKNTSPDSFAAIKITALGKPDLLEKISTVALAIRKFFKSLESPDRTITEAEFTKKIRELGVLKETVSDDELHDLFKKFDIDGNGAIDYIEWTQMLRLEDMTTRKLFTKEAYRLNAITNAAKMPLLDEHETQLLENMVNRVRKVTAEAAKHQVRLMIDAEQTYLQPAIDFFALDTQRQYNKQFATIFSTYQCYLKWSAEHLMNDIERSKREGFWFAGKIVRGAYMVLERKRAAEKGYESPIFDTIEETHANYDACVQKALMHPQSCILIASHNQSSIEKAIEFMNKHNISKDRVFFGQLLGMADHLSYTLGMNGYKVFKYIPYGPVEEVIPYLIRRAQENAAMMAGADRERQLLSKELRRRLFKF